MKSVGWRIGLPEWLIVIGSCVFIFVLWLSAYFEADIRWLHFFQSWMYVAAMWLAVRRNRWGYFVGLSAAGLWDYTSLFVNTFFRNGLHWLWMWMSTGELRRVDLILAVPAWIGNLLVIVGSAWGYMRLRERVWGDLGRFAAAFALTTGFFAAAIALCQPRYLPLFRRMLHPRWPW
jgi:hypothetical protein